MSDQDPSTFQQFLDWSTTSGIRIIFILAIVWVFQRFGRMLVQRTIRRAIKNDDFASPQAEKQREDTLVAIVSTAVAVLLWMLAGMLVVQEFGVEIGPLVAGASVFGLAIGFGAQSLVKDLVAGLFIVLENQYRIGDVISIAGVSGRVESISMRETILRNLDGDVHHIPNGIIEVTTNKTMDYSRVNLNLSVGYESDIAKVEKVIDEVGLELMNDEKFSDKIVEAPRFMWVHNFGPNEIEIKVFGKVMPGTQWAVAGEFRRRIKKAFDKNKIEIPFPQRVIHQTKKN